MKKAALVAAFALCFGAGAAHAQRSGGGGRVAGGGGAGPTNSGGGGAGGGYGGGGGAGTGGFTHHSVWVPPPNVSGKNDGTFLPTSYQSYDKAIELGKAEVQSKQPSVAEVAKMTQERKMSAPKARFTVVQDVEGKIQEVKTQP